MMKQKIRFRCAFLMIAVIFISAISGCKQNNTAVKMFKVSFDKENAGGDVTAKIKGSKFILSGAEVKEGTTVVFTARPDDDYGVQEWKGITAPSADAATVEVTVNSNIDVKVAFVKNRFIVNFVNENAGGSVSAKIKDGKALTNGEKVHAGAKVVFTAEHEEGYSVKEWKGITATPANADTVEVTVNGNIDVKVVFVGNYYTVNFTNENEGGTVSAKIKDGKTLSSGEKVQAGNIIVFTAEAGSNYEVKEWKGVTATPANAATAELKVRGNVDVKVVFEKNTFEIYITGDSNINVTKDPGQDFAVLTVKKKSNKWADIKTSAEEKVSLKDGSKYEICLWKVADKDKEKGGMLKDDYVFTAGTKIMAISIPKDNFVKACNAQVKIDGKAPKGNAYYKGVFWDTRKIKLEPYNIAATEVTYQLWYAVRIWAEANGYEFQYKGNEGSMDGREGTEPTEKSIHPVTTVHWRECIVWCNAYTQMKKGEDSCVYRKDSESGEILKNSNQSFSLFKTFMDTKKDGYRLPTEAEWEYAARYQPNNDNGNAEENGAGVWLTKLDSASGAANNTEEEAKKFAWVNKKGTNSVAELQANALGLYDMSGNVYEWCFDFFDFAPGSNDKPDGDGYTLCPLGPDKGYEHVLRGGWYAADIPLYSVGFRTKKDDATYQRGFRLASNSN